MKKYILAFITFIVGIGCMVAYGIIGSEVAPDGTLIEPFFLIPLSYLFMTVGVLIAIVISIISLIRKRKLATMNK